MPPKKRILGISLKMYFTPTQETQYITSLLTHLPPTTLPPNLQLFLIPTFLSLSVVSTLLTPHPSIHLGAQNCFYEDSGAYTGEISPLHLSQLSVSIVELGHAERRRLFRETDEMVARKVDAVLRNGMTPLVCIGEKRRGGVGNAVEEIKVQMDAVIGVLERYERGREVIFAYEPVWAIGQAEPASAEYVTGVAKELRRYFVERRGSDENVFIIYGGSAGRGTFKGIEDGVDGMFLGRFGHDLDAVADIIKEVALD